MHVLIVHSFQQMMLVMIHLVETRRVNVKQIGLYRIINVFLAQVEKQMQQAIRFQALTQHVMQLLLCVLLLEMKIHAPTIQSVVGCQWVVELA